MSETADTLVAVTAMLDKGDMQLSPVGKRFAPNPRRHKVGKKPEELTLEKAADPRSMAHIRSRFRMFLGNHLEEIEDEFIKMIKGATKDDAPRVALLSKLVDKLLPDVAERGGDMPSPVAIQINGLDRGPQRVLVGTQGKLTAIE